jgi:hypothetical protein
MKYLITNEGNIIDAATPLQIVEQLKADSRFASQESIQDYMDGFANRFEQTSAFCLRSDSVENFVEDLLRVNFLKPQ